MQQNTWVFTILSKTWILNWFKIATSEVLSSSILGIYLYFVCIHYTYIYVIKEWDVKKLVISAVINEKFFLW